MVGRQKTKTRIDEHIHKFINDIINKDYAGANANLTAAIQEKIKSEVVTVLEENP